MDCESITETEKHTHIFPEVICNNYSRFCNVGEKLSPGASAAVTVTAIYLAIAFVFVIVCVFTTPQNSTQVYNVSISTDDYNASLRIEVEHLLQPFQVKMTCQSSVGSNLQIMYDTEDRIIVYKNPLENWCYIRSSGGQYFQKDIETFQNIILGKISSLTESKKTIHLMLIPLQVPNHELRNEIGHDLYSLCKDHRSFWLSYYYNGTLFSKRRRFMNRNQHVDACFQNLIIHRDRL